MLDWFHLTMRLTVLGQMIKGAWSAAAEVQIKTDALDRIKWRLWHGNAPDAPTSVECMADDAATALGDDPNSAPLRKLGKTLGEFATYIRNNADYIVDYGERFALANGFSPALSSQR